MLVKSSTFRPTCQCTFNQGIIISCMEHFTNTQTLFSKRGQVGVSHPAWIRSSQRSRLCGQVHPSLIVWVCVWYQGDSWTWQQGHQSRWLIHHIDPGCGICSLCICWTWWLKDSTRRSLELAWPVVSGNSDCFCPFLVGVATFLTSCTWTWK